MILCPSLTAILLTSNNSHIVQLFFLKKTRLHTVNCSYTGLGLGLRFRVSGMQEIRYIRITRLCTKTYWELFLRGTGILGPVYVREFRYRRVRYKSN